MADCTVGLLMVRTTGGAHDPCYAGAVIGSITCEVIAARHVARDARGEPNIKEQTP
jgi:hypothetical protein